MKYDLEERTQKFGEDIINFAKTLQRSAITSPLISQLIRSGTSIGANYCEATGASSKKDFRNKIFICKKEAQETKHWLRMMATAAPESKEKASHLWQEAKELTLVFNKIVFSTDNK